MNKVNNAKNPPSFRDASGELKVTLQNDLFFHYLVQKSKPFLKNLVCSLKGLNPEDVRDVMDIMESGKWDIESLITHEYPWEKLDEAIEMAGRTDQALNVVIHF